MHRPQPGEKCEVDLKFFVVISLIGQSTVPGLCPIVNSGIHDEMWPLEDICDHF